MDNRAELITRREFLKTSTALCAGAFFMPEELFGQTLATNKSKSLILYNVNTRKHLDAAYFKNGGYVKSALADINKLMADKRSGDFITMDLKLINTLHKIHSLSGSKEPIDIICGYRSVGTNTKLTHSKKGIAKHSYHTLGKAADIKIAGVSLAHVHEIALSLKAGGVGYYPRSGFLHIDVGPIRDWRG